MSLRQFHESRRALILGIPKFPRSRPVRMSDKARKVICACGGSMKAVDKYANAISYSCPLCTGTCLDIDIEAGSVSCKFAEANAND